MSCLGNCHRSARLIHLPIKVSFNVYFISNNENNILMVLVLAEHMHNTDILFPI